MKRFAAVLFLILAFVPAAHAQRRGGCSGGSCGGGQSMGMSMGSCANGSCGSSMMMMQPMMFQPTQQWSPPTLLAPAKESGEVGSNRSLDFYINAERARLGLAPVAVSTAMNLELQLHVDKMAAQQAMLHSTLPYKENIGRGFQTNAGVVMAWMQVPQLRDNILSADYKTCGFATATDKDGKKYWALGMTK